MNEKMTEKVILGLLGLLVVLALLPTILDRNGEAAEKISVSGQAEKEVLPDEAVLRLSVATEGQDPQRVQDENSQTMERVKEALAEAGVGEDEIETTYYNLYPWQEYDYPSRRMVDKGYRLIHTITITTTDLPQVGKILKSSVDAGVNQVDTVAFQLSDAKENEVKAALIAEAGAKARTKAELLAKSMKVNVGDVLLLTESSYTPGIWYGRYDMIASEAKEAPAPSISPEKVTLSVTVNVDFEME